MQDDDVNFCNFDTIVFVKPDEYKVVKCGTIYTVVGTCISVLLWDKEKRTGGLAHYRMAKSRSGFSVYKGGEELLEEMYDKMVVLGSKSKNIEAVIIGGIASDRILAQKIVEENIEVAKKFLESKNIHLRSMKTGSDYPLRIRFYMKDGKITVQKIKFRGKDDDKI